MITISLCMIVKNEENTLERCLNCVRNIVDEIIIVDTGSTDNTKIIAKQFTDKIYDYKWNNNFSMARNYSFDYATKDYILWLDADDIITPENQIKLQELKQNLNPQIDIVMMKYITATDENGNPTFSYLRERLCKRKNNYRWQEPVHECIAISGKIIQSEIAITHKKVHKSTLSRNLAIYENLLNKGENLSPRGLYYYSRELKDNKQYKKAIEKFEEFLDTGQGWVEDNIVACIEISNCYLQLGDESRACKSLLNTFVYDLPRAEACSRLGYIYKNKKDFKSAVFWFQLALTLEKPENNWGFVNHDYYGYIPSLELSVCFFHLGDVQKAIYYNNMADEFKPNDAKVLHNRSFFNSLNK